MVLQKRLDYGFNGYQAPSIPRAARSARMRPTINKKVEEKNKMCAIDLLATVAGKLLLDKVSSSSSSSKVPIENEMRNEKEERVDDNNNEFKVEPCNQSTITLKPVFESEEFPEDHSGSSSVMTASNCSERLVVTKSSDDGEIKNEVASLCSKVEEDEPPKVYSNIGGCKLDGEASNIDNSNILVKDESMTSNETTLGARADTYGLNKSPVISAAPEMKMESLVHSHSNVKVVCRDDDENSSGCTHPSPRSRTRSKCFRQAPRIGDRRIRKILASKHWRPTQRYKDDSDKVFKPIFRNRKECFKRQRSHVAIPLKKRKLYDHNSSWATDDGKGTSRSVGQHASLQRRDSQVKLRIKSFRVPELIIEIAETATVGSLKRTVMEAVNAILGGELRIGVLLQGQKVRDDNVTLLQSGISHDEHLDSLGFTLEPNKPSQNQNQKPTPLCAGESRHFLSGNDEPQPLPLVSFLSSPGTDNEGISDISPEPDMNLDLGNSVESDHDSAPSPMSIVKRTPDSKALVSVPENSPKALSVIPAIRKKHPEMSQRRIRRPFSVTEVEALVHAVEKLGTGRWRDVKLRAFDDAKHRTYVDLKDKWKTLVHTARIAPQQRRGEPVPQELLDRVLNAHSYWSQQQAKQQLKQHSQTCLLI